MNKASFNLKEVTSKDLKNFKKGASNMLTSLKMWDVKDVKMINLDPEVKKPEVKPEPLKEGEKAPKVEKVPEHIGLYVLQGTHKSPNGKKFNFQIVPEIGVYKENTQQQYKVILEYSKEDSIELYPQTNSDLRAIITNYIFNPAPKKLSLAIEEAKKK